MNEILTSIKAGELHGFSGTPTHIEAAISDVFLFPDGQGLKFYKRDMEYFNVHIQDISGGTSRIDFITRDFSFNQKLNSDIYVSLQTIKETDEGWELQEPAPDDDELIIVMQTFKPDQVFTKVLYGGHFSPADAAVTAQSVVNHLQRLWQEVETTTDQSWLELFTTRITDMKQWPSYIPEFDSTVAQAAFVKIDNLLDQTRSYFDSVSAKDLVFSIDCISENMYFDGTPHFFDSYHPQANWRIADRYLDLYRIAADIRGLSGETNYNAYIKKLTETLPETPPTEVAALYELCASMISNLHFYYRSQSDSNFKPIANQYFEVTKQLIVSD